MLRPVTENLMYYEHFGLSYPPFKITPDPQFFFPGGDRGLVLEALIYAISHGEGMIKLVGEVGSGKTMLCRMLEQRLPKQIEIVYLLNPRLPPEMILHAIAFELKLPVTPQTHRLEVLHLLQNKLLEKHAAHQQVVVFIEEAQEMPLQTLEEIRLLSNLETTKHKLLQIVLFGQPELDVNLSTLSIRQLRERITHSFYLHALRTKEIADYLHFRMYAVGYRGHPVFTKSAVKSLSQISHGLIRRINILADKALLAAYSDNVHYVTPTHVCLAAKDSGFSCQKLTWHEYLSIFAILGFILFGSSLYWQQPQLRSTQITKPPMSNVSTVVNKMIIDNLLQQRKLATEQWLTQVNPQHYTIQVLQVADGKLDELAKLLRKPELQPFLKNLYVYRTTVKENTLWGVTYHQFVDSQSATEAIASLPESLQRNRPFIQTISSLRDKIVENTEKTP
jgi:type II secretory pathway predicted ATPase ExeA